MEYHFQSLISTQSRLVIASDSSAPADSVICSDAICAEVPTDDLRVGDVVLVLPGEIIPIDVNISDALSFFVMQYILKYTNLLISLFSSHGTSRYQFSRGPSFCI